MFVIVTTRARRRWTVRAFDANTYGAQVLHHAKVRETAITPLSIPMRWSVMGDNWDKDLLSERMKAEVNKKCRVLFAWMA